MTHQELWDRAYKEGLEAGTEHSPTPMIVQQHENMLDDSSPVVKTYAPVMGGVCGFAWVVVKPGTSSFARWLKDTGKAKKHDRGGLYVWIWEFGQSYEKKMKMASAMANVLTAAGINACSEGRLD